MNKLLLKPEEAGELIGMSRSKVYALLAAGELPSIRVGKSVRVPVLALQEWVDRQTTEGTGQKHAQEGAGK